VQYDSDETLYQEIRQYLDGLPFISVNVPEFIVVQNVEQLYQIARIRSEWRYIDPDDPTLDESSSVRVTWSPVYYACSNITEEAIQARVPLHPKAKALIEQYRGMDERGRLFPFISAQKYNDAIKVIFKLVGITRKVEIRNSKTGEIELIPIDQKASSHLARRTFIGNAYFKVTDPNIIGKMSGHVEGSKAFKRYRNIEDETLKDVIDRIG
jgi:integrase